MRMYKNMISLEVSDRIYPNFVPICNVVCERSGDQHLNRHENCLEVWTTCLKKIFLPIAHFFRDTIILAPGIEHACSCTYSVIRFNLFAV